jgi:hypothetical protein
MVEYHFDSNKIFQEKADRETRFGRHLGIQIEMERPLINFGHDESIFNSII